MGLPRLVGRCGPTGPDRPDRFVGHHQPRQIRRGKLAQAPAGPGARSPPRSGPASRSARVSPRQKTGSSPASKAGSHLLRQEGVHPRRRWPAARSDPPGRSVAPASRSIAAETSPVNAPSVCGWRFCPPDADPAVAATLRHRGDRRGGRKDEKFTIGGHRPGAREDPVHEGDAPRAGSGTSSSCRQ